MSQYKSFGGRFKYDDQKVMDSKEILKEAKDVLRGTEAALSKGFQTLAGTRGSEWIEYREGASTVMKFPNNGEDAIQELINLVQKNVDEVNEYKNGNPIKKIFASLGMGVSKAFEGFFGVAENVVDAGISLVGFVGGIFNPKFRDACGEIVKADVTGSTFGWINEASGINKWSCMGPESTGAKLFKFVGTATGYAVAAWATGGTAAAAGGSAAMIGLGSGTQDALQQGDSFNKAFGKGVIRGAIEGSLAYALGPKGGKETKIKGKIQRKYDAAVKDVKKLGEKGLDKVAKKGAEELAEETAKNAAKETAKKAAEETAKKAAEDTAKKGLLKTIKSGSTEAIKEGLAESAGGLKQIGGGLKQAVVGTSKGLVKTYTGVSTIPGRILNNVLPDVVQNGLTRTIATGGTALFNEHSENKNITAKIEAKEREQLDQLYNDNFGGIQDVVLVPDGSNEITNIETPVEQPSNPGNGGGTTGGSTGGPTGGGSTGGGQQPTTTYRQTSTGGGSTYTPSTPDATPTKVPDATTPNIPKIEQPENNLDKVINNDTNPTPSGNNGGSSNTTPSGNTSTGGSSTGGSSSSSTTTPSSSTTSTGSSGTSHSGGGYSGGGYSFSGSTTTADPTNPSTGDVTITPIENSDGKVTGSLASSITSTNSFKNSTIKIPTTSDPISSKSDGPNIVIPTAAAMSMAAGAGIGTKAYMEHKRNNNNDEEFEGEENGAFKTEEWQGTEDDIKIDYGTEGDATLDNEDDYSYSADSIIERYEAVNSSELEEVQ